MEESIEKWLKSDDGLYEKYYEDYVQAPDKAKWWISKRGTFRDYPGYKQVNQKVSVAPLKDRLVKSLDDEDWAKASKAYKRDVAKELGTTVDKLDSAWDEHLEDVKKSNEIQARKDEVDKWPWYKKMVASDYAKQRYINEPEKSVFSDKGEWYNKGEDVSDLLYGGAGAVADFIPGIGGTVVGPAVRGLRDVQHKVTDSKYQKEGSDILTDVGKDAIFNVAIEKTPTALLRKSEKTAKQSGKFDTFMNKVNSYNEVVNDVRKNKAGTDMLDWSNLHNMSDAQIEETINAMPDGSMKRVLEGYVADGVEKNRDKIGESLVTFQSLSDPKHLSQQQAFFDEYWNVNPNKKSYWKEQGVDDYVKNQALASKQNKLVKGVSEGLDAWQKGGGKAIIETDTAKGRGSKPNTSDREDIDWFKTNYSRDWEAGFIPRGKDDEPIMKAYREWKEERKRPSIREVM